MEGATFKGLEVLPVPNEYMKTLASLYSSARVSARRNILPLLPKNNLFHLFLGSKYFQDQS